MASTDFCAFSTAFRLWLRLSARSAQTSPGTTRFFPSIYLPHLPHAIPCSYWASTCMAALPSHKAFYTVSVRQARGLPVVSLFPHPASFRFHLAVDTLAFGYLLPAAGRIRVFHPLETCAAGRTMIKRRCAWHLLFEDIGIFRGFIQREAKKGSGDRETHTKPA